MAINLLFGVATEVIFKLFCDRRKIKSALQFKVSENI